MSIIALVRHGQTDYNKNKIIQGHVDIPLNELGIEQAYKTAANFKDTNFDLLIASPLSRAQETARIIAKEINYNNDIIIDESFIERNFGLADRKPIHLFIDKVYPEEIEGLEPSNKLKQRMIEGITKVAKENPEKDILIVCHSHSIKAALAAIEPEQYDFKTHLNNCSITLLEYKDNDLKIKKANYNDYI